MNLTHVALLFSAPLQHLFTTAASGHLPIALRHLLLIRIQSLSSLHPGDQGADVPWTSRSLYGTPYRVRPLSALNLAAMTPPVIFLFLLSDTSESLVKFPGLSSLLCLWRQSSSLSGGSSIRPWQASRCVYRHPGRKATSASFCPTKKSPFVAFSTLQKLHESLRATQTASLTSILQMKSGHHLHEDLRSPGFFIRGTVPVTWHENEKLICAARTQ